MALVLFVAKTARVFWLYRRLLFKRLLRTGHGVSILVYQTDETVAALTEMGCTVVCVGPTRWPRWWSLSRLFWRALYHPLPPSAIFFYGGSCMVWGALWTLFSSVRTVGVAEDVHMLAQVSGWRSWQRYGMALCWHRLTACVFLHQNALASAIAQRLVMPGQGFVLPGEGPFFPDFLLPPVNMSEHVLRFLMVADHSPQCGLLEYVLAARALKKKYSAVQFRVVLHAQDMPDVLPQWLSVLLADDAIMWLGRVHELRTSLVQAHVVVCPAHQACASMVVLQAAALGRALVVSDITENTDIVHHNQTGYVCQAHNPQHLALAMQDMIRCEPFLRRKMGQEARKYVEMHFSTDFVFEQYRLLLRHLGLGVLV